MGVQGKRELLSFGIQALANRPSVGQQVIPVDLGIVLDNVPLSACQDQIGEVRSQRMVTQCPWWRGFCLILERSPGSWPIIETARVKLLQNA
jgi:hypothetical protein